MGRRDFRWWRVFRQVPSTGSSPASAPVVADAVIRAVSDEDSGLSVISASPRSTASQLANAMFIHPVLPRGFRMRWHSWEYTAALLTRIRAWRSAMLAATQVRRTHRHAGRKHLPPEFLTDDLIAPCGQVARASTASPLPSIAFNAMSESLSTWHSAHARLHPDYGHGPHRARSKARTGLTFRVSRR